MRWISVSKQTDLKKKLVGEKAVEYIKDGMTIGLGSGSIVYWTLKRLGDLVQNGMNIRGIPSSSLQLSNFTLFDKQS